MTMRWWWLSIWLLACASEKAANSSGSGAALGEEGGGCLEANVCNGQLVCVASVCKDVTVVGSGGEADTGTGGASGTGGVSGTGGDGAGDDPLPSCGESGAVVVALGATTATTPECMAPWTVNGVELQLAPSGHPTCGTGACSGEVEERGVWVYPGELQLRVIGCAITRVEVDINEYAGDANIVLYDATGAPLATGHATAAAGETVTVEAPSEGTATRVGIQGCETLTSEVRIY